MWNLPGTGLESLSPALAGGFLTTAPPQKSQSSFIFESGNFLKQSQCGVELEFPAGLKSFDNSIPVSFRVCPLPSLYAVCMQSVKMPWHPLTRSCHLTHALLLEFTSGIFEPSTATPERIAALPCPSSCWAPRDCPPDGNQDWFYYRQKQFLLPATHNCMETPACI